MNKNNLKFMFFFIIAIISVTNVGAVTPEKIPVSDGFDYPVGIPDGKGGENGFGYYVIAGFEDTGYKQIPHLGEDWNSFECPTCDLDDPVYAVSNGYVRYAYDTKISSWKGVIIIDHKSPPGTNFIDSNREDVTIVSSMYAHLDVAKINEWVKEGDYVRRGQQIGVIGPTPYGSTGPHLHFEIRNDMSINIGPGYASNWVTTGWVDPRNFINANRPKITPLIGDWDNNNIDTTGTFDPHTSIFSLDNGKNQQLGEPGDFPIVGDWNGNGTDTIGVYRPITAQFFLDSNNDGKIQPDIDQTIQFGVIGDFPIVGDWNGDKKDEIGVFRSLDPESLKTTFFLKHPDRVDNIEFGTQKDFPIIGDWNNDGTDGIGVFRRYDIDHEKNAVFYIRNGAQTINVTYGQNDDIPIVGKWDNNGPTKIGVYRPSAQYPFIFNHDPLLSFSIMDKLKQMGKETIDSLKKYITDISEKPVETLPIDPSTPIPATSPSPDQTIIDKIKSWIKENVPMAGSSAIDTEPIEPTLPSQTSTKPTVDNPKWTGDFNDDTEQMILTRALYGEARGETKDGKIAVGWVIKNRAEHPRWWGNSYHSVILKPKQFSAFNEDDNNRPLVEEPLLDENWYESYEVANQIINNQVNDLTEGADHYYSISISSPYWADETKFTTQIGNHKFYRLEITDVDPIISTAPQITSITPTQITASIFVLTITGNNFDTSAVDQIFWKSEDRLVGQGTILSQTNTEIVVRQFMEGTEGVYVVKVKNADGQLSNGVDLTITAPTTSAPQITSITPTQITASTFDLTITGNNFDTSAVDQIFWKFDGHFVGQGTILSQTNTKIVVRQFMSGTEGVYVVKVKNADGQLSNGMDLTINSA